MTSQMIEYRASDIDIHKVPGGAILTAMTDRGQVVIHMTTPAFERLAHRTTRELSPGHIPPVRHSDKSHDL
ncbi:MAG TPA: hypothetical protein VMU78_06455 [Methylocella sp.]|nr:hypothetical protein [Methylocella sp.]